MKLNKFRKAFAVVFACCFALMLFLTACSSGQSEKQKENNFIENLGGVSETYAGEVSTTSYQSASVAAQAYISEQLVGGNQAQILSVGEGVELTTDEIAALNLPLDIQDGITKVEEVEVEYRVTQGDAVVLSSGEVSGTKVKVYVIKYDNDWKYFTPLPVTGDTISKNYYNSIFNLEQYRNCTYVTSQKTTINIKMSMSGMSFSMKMVNDADMTYKIAGNEIYVKMNMKTSNDLMPELDVSESIEMYIKKESNTVSCMVKMGETWVDGDLEMIDIDSWEDMIPFADQYLDYTYFVKTDFGFELAPEYLEKYIQHVMDEMDLEDVLDSLDVGMGNFDLDINDILAKYYVKEGVLSGMRMGVKMTMSMNMAAEGEEMSMKLTAKAEGTTSCTNYGTTVVENPLQS